MLFGNFFVQPLGGLPMHSAIRWLTAFNVFLIGCLGIFYLSFVFDHWSRWIADRTENISNFYFILGIWIAWMTYWVVTIFIDWKLHYFAKERKVAGLKKCRTYTSLNVTYGLVVYTFHTLKYGIHVSTFPVYSVYIIYKFYQVIIIHYFIIEINEEVEQQSSMRNMTDLELEEFLKGSSPESCSLFEERKDLSSLQDKVVNLQYNNCSEIRMENLSFDESPLGSGAFGTVYKGKLQTESGSETTVAVKTINPVKVDISCFKALLLELKVMTRLGQHDHIVQFIGACTSDIRQRKLLIALEFCSLGNLNHYLKSYSGLFVNMLDAGNYMKDVPLDHSIDQEEQITTKQLIQWSSEIALGMDYLGKNKVIHGDLATRNILLTGDKVVKITDFGLARQLYAYSIYVKKQNTPLPWRHMALESFVDMTFSTATDVWSYAVTLWEIFTLIATPWAEDNFTMEFVEQIKQGRRLGYPQFAPTNIYQLMLNCWKAQPLDRPEFKQILFFFMQEYNDEVNFKIDVP